MSNYSIVLFKNKTSKKILKEFVTFKKAKQFLSESLKNSDNVIFEKLFENGKSCRFEIALVENSSSQLIPVYLTDEYGRNVKVKLDKSGKTISEISLYRIEEKLYDIQENKKIYTEDLIKRYLKGTGLKMMFALNNKIVIQLDDNFKIFSLKNENEVMRFLDVLTDYFQKNNKKDCLVNKDNSSAQKKYLLKILSESGFDKKMLYRKSTTHPRA
jgi:hypothetical protein